MSVQFKPTEQEEKMYDKASTPEALVINEHPYNPENWLKKLDRKWASEGEP